MELGILYYGGMVVLRGHQKKIIVTLALFAMLHYAWWIEWKVARIEEKCYLLGLSRAKFGTLDSYS